MISVYVGNDPSALDQFESWLGRRVDAHQVFIGERDWNDWTGGISWQIDLWKNHVRPIMWSIPLIPAGATLAAAASGAYDARYIEAARILAAGYTHSDKIYVRTGWEFNADWMKWSAIGRPNEFIGAYRRFVTAFRTVSSRFVFEWTPNIGDVGMNPELAYPGDDYVDWIGLDFYYFVAWNPSDGREAWKKMVTQPYGLQWHQDFAKSRSKPTTYAEWGVQSNSPEYILAASEWFRSHPVAYQSYWNSNAAFPGKLSDGQYPSSAEAYRQEYQSAPICTP